MQAFIKNNMTSFNFFHCSLTKKLVLAHILSTVRPEIITQSVSITSPVHINKNSILTKAFFSAINQIKNIFSFFLSPPLNSAFYLKPASKALENRFQYFSFMTSHISNYKFIRNRSCTSLLPFHRIGFVNWPHAH